VATAIAEKQAASIGRSSLELKAVKERRARWCASSFVPIHSRDEIPRWYYRRLNALDWLNFFLADVRGGLGAYVNVFLLTGPCHCAALWDGGCLQAL
jgi:hypothetical protein